MIESKEILTVVILTLSFSLAFLLLLLSKKMRKTIKGNVSELSLEIVRKEFRLMLPIMLSVLAAMLTFAITIVGNGDKSDSKGLTWILKSKAEIQLEDIREQVRVLQVHLKEMEVITGTSAAVTGIVNSREVFENIKRLNKRMEKFEVLVKDGPEDVVNAAFLQRDLNSVKDQMKDLKVYIDSQSEIVHETNTQNRFLLGTIAFGMLGLVYQVVRLGMARKDN